MAWDTRGNWNTLAGISSFAGFCFLLCTFRDVHSSLHYMWIIIQNNNFVVFQNAPINVNFTVTYSQHSLSDFFVIISKVSSQSCVILTEMSWLNDILLAQPIMKNSQRNSWKENFCSHLRRKCLSWNIEHQSSD